MRHLKVQVKMSLVESAAASFQNKEKGAENNLIDMQEQKRMEKQRRKERKALEKKKVRAE